MNTPPNAEPFQVDLQPAGRRVRIHAGSTLLDAIRKAGLELVASCGGAGFCGTCRVRVVRGQVNPLSPAEMDTLEPEQLAAGLRLACQVIPLSDVKVDLPPESLAGRQQLQVDGRRESATQLAPAVTITALSLAEPDLAHIDAILAVQGCPPLDISPEQFSQLSSILIHNGGQGRLVTRTRSGQSSFVTLLPPGQNPLGLAMDIGSTKVALYLLDLETGGTLASTGILNPQLAFGEDVVSRIAWAARGEEQRRQLQTSLVEAINAASMCLCEEIQANPAQICDCVAVGNTVIHHLLCGLPVAQLGHAPYALAVEGAVHFPAADIGLNLAPGAWIYLPPNIAGYVGADHLAALLAAMPLSSHQTCLLMDIGTNTEISLLHDGKITACSCASGPAFEGAHIHDGLRAVPGAIEKVRVETDGRLSIYTIASQPPIGLCGSGVLSAVAALYQAGWLDRRGAILRGERKQICLVAASESGHHREVVLTRKDIHEIQLAKGAIRAGIDTLLSHAGISASAVETWLVAGAFGTHIDLRSAVAVGMFPDQPLERFHQVGNAAGMGARQLLLSRMEREKALALLAKIHYLELARESGFQQTYLESLYFPEKN
ncbi:MAG TPA: ASKHA domain-containing protein [Anaerolineaceae bacterium]|nr:ASKHA domain-containing protein [Anaerolineaceae bacterium]HPN53625.1 ASKHA domain-containing protein [Anaerolineaceae bacterium]